MCCCLRLFLLPRSRRGHSRNFSRKLARSNEKDRVAEGVGCHSADCLSHRKSAGRMLETAGSAGDLKHQSAVRQSGGKVYAISSLREIHFQQTSVFKAKYARAGQFSQKEIICAGTSAGRPGRI